MRTRDDLIIGYGTHVGLERQENQDDFLVYEPHDDARFARVGRLLAVADGMGGAAGGRTASRLALRALLSAYVRTGEDSLSAGVDGLVTAIGDANRALLEAATEDAQLQGMGTTMTVAQLHDGCLHLAHVGDSRLYLLRGGSLEQITEDHVDVPGSNLLTRCIGAMEELEVDVTTMPLQAGDLILLCSDGLWDLVEPAALTEHLLQNPPAQAAELLIRSSLAAGAHDNVTLVICRIGELTPSTRFRTVTTQSPAPEVLERGFVPLQPVWFSRAWALAGLVGLLAAALALLVRSLRA